MNPSYEYMSRISHEKQAALLDMRRERVTKALDSLTLHGDSHAMLTQIAYSVHPHVGAWDAESCDHLRNVLKELIGDAREAASGVESHIPCGASGCHSGDEQKEVETERQEAVNKLRGTFLDTGSALKKLATALGVYWDASNTNKSVASLQRRLIHLLGDDEYYVLDTSKAKIIGCEPDASESDDGMSVTKELRDWITLHKAKITSLSLDDCSIDEGLTEEGKQLVAIADRIDARVARLTHDAEMWRDRAEDMRKERDEYRKEMDDAYGIAATFYETFYEECRMYRDMLNDAAGEYKALDRMSAETSANFHAMRDRVWGLEAERDELQARLDELGTQNSMLRDKLDELSTSGATELYKLLKRTVGDAKQIADKLNAHNGMLKESERLRYENARCAAVAVNKACMYLDLLRDAAMDYKALQDRLNHMVEVCQSYTEVNA